MNANNKYNRTYGGDLLALTDLSESANRMLTADKEKQLLTEKDKKDLNTLMVEAKRAQNDIHNLFNEIEAFFHPWHQRLGKIFMSLNTPEQPGSGSTPAQRTAAIAAEAAGGSAANDDDAKKEVPSDEDSPFAVGGGKPKPGATKTKGEKPGKGKKPKPN